MLGLPIWLQTEKKNYCSGILLNLSTRCACLAYLLGFICISTCPPMSISIGLSSDTRRKQRGVLLRELSTLATAPSSGGSCNDEDSGARTSKSKDSLIPYVLSPESCLLKHTLCVLSFFCFGPRRIAAPLCCSMIMSSLSERAFLGWLRESVALPRIGSFGAKIVFSRATSIFPSPIPNIIATF